jgi:hypothetical protein
MPSFLRIAGSGNVPVTMIRSWQESTLARHSRYRSVSRCLNLPSCSPHLLQLSYPVWFRLCRLRLYKPVSARRAG